MQLSGARIGQSTPFKRARDAGFAIGLVESGGLEVYLDTWAGLHQLGRKFAAVWVSALSWKYCIHLVS